MPVPFRKKIIFCLMVWGGLLSCFLLPGTISCAAESEGHSTPASELPDLRLHELMSLEVTSAAKKEQKLSETSSAVFVITREDIRRSGVTSIPEALRMAPGLLVARIDSNKWAISARSFNSLYANKLLVLIDGRSVFNTLYAAVFWTNQDLLLEDVDRIEVIRGPAAALWGTNAVNGVVNVITRKAQHTLGPLVSAGAGTEEQGFIAWRYGGRSGTEGAWRVFGKHFSRDASRTADDHASHDDWRMHRAGFRYDQRLDARAVTLRGELFRGRAGLVGADETATIVIDDTLATGGNLMFDYQQRSRFGKLTKVRFYYDYESRRNFLLNESRRSYDLDFQDEFSLGANDILWGGGYRFSDSLARGSIKYSLRSVHRRESIYNFFVQNDLTLAGGQLVLTLGSKFEHNHYTHWEVQPNLRLLILLSKRSSLWGALSRAARTPSRFDRESQIEVNGAGTLSGNKLFKAEKVVAYELGYRYSCSEIFSLDLALFYNDYTELRSFESSGVPPNMIGTIGNRLEGETNGAELAMRWTPLRNLRTILSGTYIHTDFRHRDAGASDFDKSWAQVEEDKTPRYQGYLRIDYDPTKATEIGTTIRYVSRIRRDDIAAYVDLDLRMAWSLSNVLTFELIGQNLLDSRRQEFPRESLFSIYPSEVERSVFVKAVYRH